MRVIIEKDYEEMSKRAATVVAKIVRNRPDCVLGLATGSTPVGMYKELIRMHREEGLDFSRVTTFNLDEYYGLPPTHDQSYRYFMQENLFDGINVAPGRISVPSGTTSDVEGFCAEYERMIEDAGGIDIQVLGIGGDGHIAFNEPGSSLGSRTRLVTLDELTIEDNARFFEKKEDVPRFAVTMGVGTILEAKCCLLMVNGAKKADVLAKAIEGPITSQVTASALQLHPDVVTVVDEEATSGLERRAFYVYAESAWREMGL